MRGMQSILSTRAEDRSYSFDAPISGNVRPRYLAADIVRPRSIAGSAVIGVTCMNERGVADCGRFGRRRLLALTAGALGLGAVRPELNQIQTAAAQEIVPSERTAPVPESEVAPTTPGAGTLYFAETGHNLAEPFRSRWNQAGGESVFGAPLSEERYAAGAGGVLQSFENLVMLFDPGQAPPNDVRGQPLGKSVWAEALVGRAGDPVTGCQAASANCRFFPETNHTLSEPFASFWQQWGGETLFGPPVSEPFTDPADPGALMQVFESAILESRGGVVSL